MNAPWRNLAALAFRRELRSRDGLAAGLALVGTFLLLSVLSVETLDGSPRLAALVLWAPILYGGIATVARGIEADHDRQTMPLLRALPCNLAAWGMARTAVAAVLVAALGACTLVAADALFALEVGAPLAAVVGLAALGVATVGALAGGLAAQARGRSLLLPVLAVPVLAPLLQAGVGATLELAAGPGGDVKVHLLVMGAYDAAALAVAWLLWPVVLEGD